MQELPRLLTNFKGNNVTSENWEERRRELVEILAGQVYGPVPPASQGYPHSVRSGPVTFGGKLRHIQAEIGFGTPGGEFTFPLNVWIPLNSENPSLILLLNFRRDVPDRYFPLEEICDRGFGAALICYEDITSDDADFTHGLAGRYMESGIEFGKISLWACAAIRGMDFLQTLENINPARISVAGHSRLGKAALWAAANDPRFHAVFSNESGCAGAALHRGKDTGAESAELIIKQFPFWFREEFTRWAGREEEMPFDQHFLLAASAPRLLYVASAKGDAWAAPPKEYAACAAASPAWEIFGHSFHWPTVDFTEPFSVTDGPVGYHLREYEHCLSRYDWNKFMDFLEIQRDIR